jgi:hypothetical protein
MTAAEIERLQTYLRTLFGSDAIKIVPPVRRGLSVEMVVKGETVGTVHQDVDEGETSYSIHLTVLEEDLPALAKPPPGRR